MLGRYVVAWCLWVTGCAVAYREAAPVVALLVVTPVNFTGAWLIGATWGARKKPPPE